MTTPAKQQKKVKLSGPGDMLDAIPYLIGFHPVESLVALGLRGDERLRVGVTMRIDLPPAGDQAAIAELATTVRSALVEDGSDKCFLVAFLPAGSGIGDNRSSPMPPVLLAVGDAAEEAGVRVHDAVVVADGRWRSMMCHESSCCPAEGRPHDPGRGSRVGAEMAFAGMAAAPSRDHAVAALAPVGGLGRVALDQHVDRICEEVVVRLAGRGPRAMESARDGLRVEGLALIGAAIARYQVGAATGRFDDVEAARLLVLLSADVCLRDAAYERSVNGDRLAARACWTDLVRRAPVGVVAPVATVLGLLAWYEGDGFTAQTAVERALVDDCGYRMALLLQTMITHRLRDDAGPALRAIRRQAAGWGRRGGGGPASLPAAPGSVSKRERNRTPRLQAADPDVA